MQTQYVHLKHLNKSSNMQTEFNVKNKNLNNVYEKN